MCLDLSIPELAFLDVKAPELASAAADGQTFSLVVGRLLLVGLPQGVNPAEALFDMDAEGGDPTFAIACRIGLKGEPEIAAAQYWKPVTFELSEFEKRALSAVASSKLTGPNPRSRGTTR